MTDTEHVDERGSADAPAPDPSNTPIEQLTTDLDPGDDAPQRLAQTDTTAIYDDSEDTELLAEDADYDEDWDDEDDEARRD